MLKILVYIQATGSPVAFCLCLNVIYSRLLELFKRTPFALLTSYCKL